VFARNPRLGLAGRTALSATLAWVIVLALPGEIPDTYPYFAPLGAVVGSYSTVRSSVRNSFLAWVAIVCGAIVSLAVAQVFGRDLFVIPVIVFLATLLAGWRRFEGHGSWVLSVGVFVLVAGAEHPVRYAIAYALLTLLGSCVAIGVNALLPALPVGRSSQALQELASVLADQLADLADGLRLDTPPESAEWENRLRTVEPVRESLRTTRNETEESLRGNVRARRNLDRVRRQHVAGVALENTAVRIEELTELLMEVQVPEERDVALQASLRVPVADVLAALAASLRRFPEVGEDGDDDQPRQALLRLSEVERHGEFTNDRDRQTAGAVVTALRRCLGALPTAAADDPVVVIPARWRRPMPDRLGRRRS
jgi:uncharacterized membrane protein YgaE (UPF0421/DUF939 family)